MTPPPPPTLARSLGLFDATMIVMGGIVGAGIFMNPAVVASRVGTPFLILGAWLAGGAIALAGAFIYAEIASLRPGLGGQYAYLRDAFHPAVAFVYGWTLLLVTQSGGMAAVAITFSRYFVELLRVPVAETLVATVTLALLTVVNCLGVRAGSAVQNGLMLTKIAAIALLVGAGWRAASGAPPVGSGADHAAAASSPLAFGAALVPVLFAYGGWQTASFVAAELRRPERDLARGLVLGVTGVVLLYLSVNVVCLLALGPAALAATPTPASAVMRLALGEPGATLIGAGIAVSTLGFLSQGMLTAPRVYYAMARDGVFFESVGRLSARTRVPVVAIAIQGAMAAAIALSGRYEQILSYVVSVDWIGFGLTAASLFVFRRRKGGAGAYPTPLQPITTALFVLAAFAVVVSTVYSDPGNTAIGLGILLAGVPVFFLWRRRPA